MGWRVNPDSSTLFVFAQHAHCTPTTVVVLGTGSSQWTVHNDTPRATITPCVVSPACSDLGVLSLLGPQFLVLYNGRVGSGRVHTVQQLKAEQVCVRVRSGLQGSPLDCPFRSPQIRFQGLESPKLQEHCREHPGDFPSEDALWRLSRQDFLRTLNVTLGLVLRMLSALQQDLPEAAQQQTEMNVRGFGNNIHCMAQLLRGSLDPEAAEPTQPGPGPTLPPLLPPMPPSSTFQRKLRNCRFLRGYHHFMRAAGQVLRSWGERRGRSRRHSPHRALQRGARRTRPFLEVRRLSPRGQLPR